MRNALLSFVLIILPAISSATSAAEGIAQPAAVYAVPANNNLTTPENGFLPLKGLDLPLTDVDSSGSGAAGPQASAVEAIPTPTAFQAGIVLLLIVAVGRTVNKRLSRSI